MYSHQVLHPYRLRAARPSQNFAIARAGRQRLRAVAFRRDQVQKHAAWEKLVRTADGCAAPPASIIQNISSSSSSRSTDVSFSFAPHDPLNCDIRLLQRKNRSTQTLLLARDARIQVLLACFHSQGREPLHEVAAAAEAATAAAAKAGCAVGDVEDIMLEQQQHSISQQELHRRLVARNTALMALGRAKNEQIRALEAALAAANIRLPRWRFDTTSSSSAGNSAASVSGDSNSSTPDASVDRPGGQLHTDDLRVHFNVKCAASLGDSLWLVGNHPALGSWHADGSALPLQWTPGDMWQGDLALASRDDLLLSFKAVLKRGSSGQLQWQPGPNREIVLGRLMDYDKEPLVASMDFYGYDDELPLNYADACIKACKKLLGCGRPDCYNESGARQAAEAAVDALIWKTRAQQQIAAQIAAAQVAAA